MTNQYTTGQAAGMTGIPVKTMQRYIRLYPEGFSTSARQPDRGRRYTADDIKTLLLIRHLYSQREKPDQIRQAITADGTPEMDLQNLSDMMSIASAARQDLKEISGKLAEWRRLWGYRDAHVHTDLRDIVQDLDKRVRFIEINLGLRKSRQPVEQSKPGFFDRLLGG